jgi:hypothetical protein
LIVAGLTEPEDSLIASSDNKAQAKVTIPGRAIQNYVLMFFSALFWMPSLLFVSIVVTEKGLGTGVHAGSVAIMFNVSAILLSFAFSFLYKTFKKFLVIIVLLLVAAGMFIEYSATSLVMVGVGMFLTGAFLLVIPTLLTDNGKYLDSGSITFAASLLIIAMNVAGFVAGPFVTVAESLSGGNVPIAGLYFGIIGQAAVVVVFFVIRLLQKDKTASAATAAAA